MTDRTFDWRKSPDSHNQLPRFAIADTLPAPIDLSKPKSWALPYVRIDQGSEGACVGFAATNELLSMPVRARPPGYDNVRGVAKTALCNGFARGVYHDARKVDEWPGEAYEGTSVNAGAKVLRARGLISGWLWADEANPTADIDRALLTPAEQGGGPVPIGLMWSQNMYDTDDDGMVDIRGRIVGGHSILIVGRHPRWQGQGVCYKWLNSWGPSYGVNGVGYIRRDDLHTKLADGEGEACLYIGRAS